MTRPEQEPGAPIRLGAIGGVVAVAAGFLAISMAWYHSGTTDQVWIQNQELISGGVGGLGAAVVGVGSWWTVVLVDEPVS